MELLTQLPLPDDSTVKLRIDQRTLEKHVWDAQELLRGNVDASEFKDYIFGLFMLKVTVDNSAKDLNLREKWITLTQQRDGIGDSINKLMLQIETVIPNLHDTLSNFDYRNRKLADAVLRGLVQHYCKYDFRQDCFENPDALGHAYEFLLGKFADTAGRKGGEFYTPPCVNQLISRIIKPERSDTIYDPTCGTGGLLLNVAKLYCNPVYGQELNASTAAIARMNLHLHKIAGDIRQGNTLTDPKHIDKRELRTFDVVVANPPFSVKKWRGETLDRFNRFDKYGKVPDGQADYAFIIHCLESLTCTGKAAIVMSPGTLFRGGAEGELRERVLKTGWVKAIIALPPNLFYNTSAHTCMWVFDKSQDPGEGIFIVNAGKLYRKKRTQSVIEEEHVDRIVLGLQTSSIPRFSRYVDLEEIAKNDYNVNPKLYVEEGQPVLPVVDRELQLGGIPLALLEHEFVRSTLATVDYDKVFKLIDQKRQAYWWADADKNEVGTTDICHYLRDQVEYNEDMEYVYKELSRYSLLGMIGFNRRFVQNIGDVERMIAASYNGDRSTRHTGHPDPSVPLAEWTVEQLDYRIEVMKDEICERQRRVTELEKELKRRT